MEVLHIEPIAKSAPKITLFIFLTLVVFAAGLASSLFMGVTLLIFELSALIVWFRHNSKIRIKMFYSYRQWEEQNINQFAVYTIASKEDQRHTTSRVFVVKKVAKVGNNYIFKYHQELYRTNRQHAQKLPQNQILRLLEIQDIQYLLMYGLNDKQIQKSKQLFGEQQLLTSPSLWKLFVRNVDFQMDWVMLNLNSLFFSKSISNTFEFTMVGLVIISFIIILITSYLDLKIFKNKYSWIQQKKYTVLRNRQRIRLSVHQLLVGDVVFPSGQGQFQFLFGCMLAGQIQLVVKTSRDETIKSPLKSMYNLMTLTWMKHYIQPFSKADRAQLRDTQRFIVTEHNSISKHFARWFKKPLYPVFTPPSVANSDSAQNFFYIALVVQILLFALLSLIEGISITSATQPFYLGSLRYYLIQAPVLFLLYELSFFSVRLHLGDMSIFSSIVVQSGLTTCLLINFSKLPELQFQELLYKNKILGFQTENFEPNSQTLKYGQTYESLLTNILYISLGKFDEGNTLLRQVYEHHKEHYDYVDGLNQNPDIKHEESGKKWEVLKVFQENQDGRRSWLVHYQGKVTYIISEMPCNGNPFRLLGDKQDSKKRQNYSITNKQLQQEGKLVKIMLFRNLKEERLRGSNQSITDYTQWPRQKLQLNYQFGTFLVFDHALQRQTVDAINQLKHYGGGQLSISFVSSQGREELSGFQHILTNIPIIYGCSAEQIGKITTNMMNQDACMYIGGAIQDQHAFQISDVAVQFSKDSEQSLLPADISINDVRQLLPLLKIGRWMLQVFNEMARMSIVFTLYAVLGGVFLDRTVRNFFIPHQLAWSLFATGIFIMGPAIIRLIFMKQGAEEYIPRNTTFFTKSLLTAIPVITIYCIILVFMAELKGLCHPKTGVFLGRKKPPQECIDLFILLSSSSVTILFVIFSGNNCKAQNHLWGRLLMVPVWIGVLFLNGIPLQFIGYAFLGFILIFFAKVTIKLFAKEGSN